MSNPLPSLSRQSADILRLVATYLSLTDHATFTQLSSDFTSVRVSYQQRRSGLQCLQWKALFPGQFSSDFRRNEELLERIGLRTIELSPTEEVALKMAWRSLQSTPSELSSAAKQNLTRQRLPLHSQRMAHDLIANPVPILEGIADDAFEADVYRRELLNWLFLRDRDLNNAVEEGDRISTFDAQSLSQVALLEDNFEDALRIFSVDGARYQRRSSSEPGAARVDESRLENANSFRIEVDLFNLAIIRITGHHGSFGRWAKGIEAGNRRKQYGRNCLLLLLVAMGQPPRNSYCIKSTRACHFPAITQILSVAGYDFLRVDPIIPVVNTSYFGDCTPITGITRIDSLCIVMDRLLDEGRLNKECLRRIRRTLPSFGSDRHLIEGIRKHLATRGINL